MNTQLFPVELEDGNVILVEAVMQDREQDVTRNPFSFKNTADSVKSVVKSLVTPLADLKLGKIKVEIELGLAFETGKIVSMLAASKASSILKISVEFDK